MDYLLKEVNNYTLLVGDKSFIVHDPLLDILPNIRLLKTKTHFDLNDLLLDEYVETVKIRFENDIIVYDENGEAQYNEPLILRLLGDSFNTIYRLLYKVDNKFPFYSDDEEFHLKIETIFWLIDFLGLNTRMLSSPEIRKILNNKGLTSILVKEQELEEVADILKWLPGQGTINIYALASILDKSETPSVIEELKSAGYFALSALVDMLHIQISKEDDYSFSEIFYNVNIENYYIISQDKARIVIHSPVTTCNFDIQEEGEIFIKQPSVIIELALNILYYLLRKTSLAKFKLLLETLGVTKENMGRVYFIFKQLIVFPLFTIGEKIAEYFLIDYDIDNEDPTKFGTTSALLRSAAVRGDVKYLDTAFFIPQNLRGKVAPYISYIVGLLIKHNKYHKAAMYDCFSSLVSVTYDDEDDE